ncbi:hypothetical protein [Streptomyces sp. SP18BB07]|uniref:hypothetical protein n=1 Tax=Streptomyces sp. SP18BB07 TaxID=3002522 RepID=UPI002E75BD6F|nr:hypothetical protein [Streptomyces sp. SP18BB07]MEE1759475.1 hypothetical protein [Streptomyces sp. SP18BB07]
MSHAAFGGLVALAWLLLPTTTQTAAEERPTGPHAAERSVTRVMGPPVGDRPAAAAPGRLVVAPVVDGIAAPADDSAGSDLILPVAAAGTAVAVAAYSLVRRRRRARLRTTPTGVFEAPTTPLTDLHHRARRLLVETDDSVRTSTEELGFAATRPGHPATTPPAGEAPGPAEAEQSPETATDRPEARPDADQPGTNESGVHRPARENPDTDQPTSDQPTSDQPTSDQPTAGQPTSDRPTSDQPTAGQPTSDRPTSDQPTAGQPTSDRPTSDQPPTDRPTASKSDMEQSGLDRPDVGEPHLDGRHLDRPDVEKPDADEPDAAGPPGSGPLGSRAARPFVLDPAQPFAETPAMRDAVRPFVEALADARGELVAAFGAGQRLDEESGSLSPDEERALLEEILTRCTTAQRRLDTATPAFDQLRALERDITPALECAEARFRELTGRTATATTTLVALRDTYAPAASLPVTGHVEQAKDRLVFATTELNRARQSAYPGDLDTAAVHLRAAEGAIDQADLFVTGVERLAAELADATEFAKQGEPHTGPYDDPLDVLRRQDRWLLPSRSAVAAAADFITTHRAAVGVRARTRLSEAERHLGLAGDAENADHARRADTLALEARELAEQDVRAYGNPYGGPVGDGLAGALLGGIILGEPPDGTGRADLRGPACYGGTATRARRAVSARF